MPAVARSISTHDTADRRKSITPALPDVPRENMIRGMPDLLAALRARRDEIGVTHETLDSIANWPSGYAGKLLAPVPIKNLGWMSLGWALDSMGVALVLVENVEQRRLVEKRWIKRQRPIQPTDKRHNRSCKPSRNVENTESVKIAAPQSQPAPVSRAHLSVVQSKGGRRYG